MNIALIVFFNMLVSLTSHALADPTNIGVELMQKAQQAELKKKWPEAEQAYQSLIAMDSDLKEYAYFYYGLLLQKNSRPEEAKKQFEKMMELSPNMKLQGEAQFRLSQIYIDEKNFIKAKKILLPLEKKFRKEEVYPDIIWSLAKTEKGLNSQSHFCKWVTKIYSRYPEYKEISSWSLNLKENLFEGKPTLCVPSTEALRTRIKSLQWAGLSEKVKVEIEQLKKNVTIDQDEIESLEVFYLLREGEVTHALDMLVQHYDSRKNNFSYLTTLASAAARAGELQLAVGSYYKAAKLGRPSKKGREALYQSAFLSYQFQDYDGAARRFQEFIKIYPNSGLSKDAKWHLAWIRYLKADYEGAYRSLKMLIEKPTNPRIGGRNHARKSSNIVSQDRVNYWIAMSLLKQKKWEESKNIFEVLVKDPLKSYYSVAAQFRLKKIESQLPKKMNKSAADLNRRLARYSTTEMPLPSDDVSVTPPYEDVQESQESEETLLVSTLRTEEGEAPSEELSANDSIERPPEAVDKENPEGKSSSVNPNLLKKFARAKELVLLGLKDWAKWDLYEIEKKTTNREYLKKLIFEYEAVENFNRSSYIGQTQFGTLRAQLGLENGRNLWESTYPRAYSQFVSKYSKQFSVPDELVWGIMRAESQYKKDVISPVGALGLMQVMPNTGLKISKMLGENSFSSQFLLEPEISIKIGARYLQRLAKKFDGSVPLIAAGYNAGPHRVKTWLASFGYLDIDEFIEHIPFLETRNYVKKVVSNYQIYNQLYGIKKEALSSLAEANTVHAAESINAKESWEDM